MTQTPNRIFLPLDPELKAELSLRGNHVLHPRGARTLLLNYCALMELGIREHTLTLREAGLLCDLFPSPLQLDALDIWPQTLMSRIQRAQQLQPYSKDWELPLSVLLNRIKRLGNLAACALYDALLRKTQLPNPSDLRSTLREIFCIPVERDDWHHLPLESQIKWPSPQTRYSEKTPTGRAGNGTSTPTRSNLQESE